MQKSIFMSAFLAFFSTTLDDFAVMLVFFSRAQQMEDVRMGYMKVILGQTIGFSIVILISLMGLVLGIFIPTEYVDLIGFIPVIAGLQKVYEVLAEDGYCCCCKIGEGNGEDRKKRGEYQKVNTYDDGTNETGSAHGSTHAGTAQTPHESSSSSSYQKGGSKVVDGQIVSAEEVESALGISDASEDEEEEEANCLSECVKHSCMSCMEAFTLEVVVYALICSSDNIGIYLTLFASERPWQVLLIVATFYVLLLSNIAVALLLMQCRAVADCFQNYSKYFVPPLLIFLGLYILSSSVIMKYI